MNLAEKFAPWYELRARLRSEFIRCMEEGRSFPRTRQRLLDRVEDVVAQMEFQHRTDPAKESVRPGPSTPNRFQPRRDALERTLA